MDAYVTVTNSECDRVYLRLKPANDIKACLQARYRPQSGLQLLSVPFSDLKDLLEEEVSDVLIVTHGTYTISGFACMCECYKSKVIARKC